jgi:hypothetical protein
MAHRAGHRRNAGCVMLGPGYAPGEIVAVVTLI